MEEEYPKDTDVHAFENAKVTCPPGIFAGTSPSGFAQNLHPLGRILGKISAKTRLSAFSVHNKTMHRSSSNYG